LLRILCCTYETNEYIWILVWKNSLDENIQYIRKQNTILKDLERMCENTSGIISNLLNDAKVLDSKQLEKVNCSSISELPFSPDVQVKLNIK